ncbi:NUDIX domain-containing protein [Patescibacteria group bacterium]|nr:NUDIX domain-containing protein [Patescibacteria group bacterium]
MEHERPKVGIGVLIIRDGKILLGKRIASHGADTYQIPGGHLEFGETFEETAKREAYEEVGLTDLKVIGLVSVVNDRVYDKHFVSIGMLTESAEGDPVAMEPLKSADWAWYAPDELPENIFLPSKHVIEHWLKGAVYTAPHE